MDIDDIEREFLRIKTCLESGRECFAKKQYDEGRNFFEEALALFDRGHSPQHPDRMECLSLLADTLIAIKDFTGASSALTELHKSTNADSNNKGPKIVLLLKLSYCLEKSGRLKDAADCYADLIALVDNEQSPSNQTLALIIERYQSVLSRMGVRGAKVKALEERARDLRKEAYTGETRVIRLLETIEELYGEESEPKNKKARSQSLRTWTAGTISGPSDIITSRLPAIAAVIVVAGLLFWLTKSSHEEQFQSPGEQYTIAKSCCFSGDYLKASAIFDHLLAQNPRLAAFYWYNGGCKVKLGSYDAAAKNYSSLLDLLPDFEPALVGRAGAYLFQQDYDRALTDCNDAIRINPKDAKAYDFRGAALLGLGRNDQAELDRRKVLSFTTPARDAYIWPAVDDPVFPVAAAAAGVKQRSGKSASQKP